jgi:hypothetical protein
MLPNDLFTGLDAARIARIMQLMQQLEAELDFVIKLDPEDRQSVNAVDQGRQPFVDLTRDYTANYTALLEISATTCATRSPGTILTLRPCVKCSRNWNPLPKG